MLTENQQRILAEYAAEGGKILIAGRIAEGSSLASELEKNENALFVSLDGDKTEYMSRFMDAFEPLYSDIAPVSCNAENIGVQRYDAEGRTWIHILNYAYDESADSVGVIKELKLSVRDVVDTDPVIYTPEDMTCPDISVVRKDSHIEIALTNVGLYTVIEF